MDGLPYELVRSSRRTMTVEVHPTGSVIVRSPNRMPLYEIERFLAMRQAWINERLQDVEAKRSVLPQRTQPNHFYHRGEVLEWGWQNADVLVPQQHTTRSAALRYIERWQRAEARSLFSSMISEHLPAIGVPGLRYQGLKLRRMKRRWGSCSSTGHITLNEHLIRVPDGCIRGVVVHELCHLVHLHHGAAFHHLVADVYPDHRLSDTLLDAWTSVLHAHADAFVQSSSNADVSDAAIISGVRPSM
ncbi:MAG TPA: SprT family zinc-dependent metalloprotease [Candidatus Didemnitutus sp.]|nr:SprT family zinc-dependent metalloprotease [Candidatus Didemnitutus sp.]